MSANSTNLLRSTLELLILKALSGDARHGYGVLEWMEDATGGALALEEGTLYPALHRMERRGLIESDWGPSENNRRAKFYRLTADGRSQLERETREWLDHAALVARALEVPLSPASAS